MGRPSPTPHLRCLPIVMLLLGSPGPVLAAETAVVQEILDGKELFIDQQQAKVQQKARAPQQLTTRNSRGQILFNGGAVGRLNTFSQLRLGSSCFLVDKGQVLISGNQNGCTRSARLSVRGTNYLIEVNEAGESDISVLEGRVEVERLEDGQPGGTRPSILEAGQRLRLSPRGLVLALLKLDAGDYERLLNGPLFRGYRLPIPGSGALEAHLKRRFPGLSLPFPSGGSVLPLPQPPSPPAPPFGLPRFF
jgi:FecR protein